MSFDQIASEFKPMTSAEGQSRRKLSITIGLILGFLVVSFYAVTIVRLKGNVAKRAQMQSSGGSYNAEQSVAPATVKPKQGQ